MEMEMEMEKQLGLLGLGTECTALSSRRGRYVMEGEVSAQ